MQIGKHLRVHYLCLSLQQRRTIVSRVEELIGLTEVPLDIIYPLLSDPPVTYLPLYFNGLKCNRYDA
jgi:hypothetical protein